MQFLRYHSKTISNLTYAHGHASVALRHTEGTHTHTHMHSVVTHDCTYTVTHAMYVCKPRTRNQVICVQRCVAGDQYADPALHWTMNDDEIHKVLNQQKYNSLTHTSGLKLPCNYSFYILHVDKVWLLLLIWIFSEDPVLNNMSDSQLTRLWLNYPVYKALTW